MGSSAMGILAVVHSAAVGTGVKVPLGYADTESSGYVSTLPEFGASHRSLENTPNAEALHYAVWQRPSSQKEIQVFKLQF